jgi:hypothetical protein
LSSRATYGRTRSLAYSRLIDAKSFSNRFVAIDVIRYCEIEVRFVVERGGTCSGREEQTSKCGPGLAKIRERGRQAVVGFFF